MTIYLRHEQPASRNTAVEKKGRRNRRVRSALAP